MAQIVSHRQEVDDAMNAALMRALEIVGGMAESYAKEACPVDTGLLRNSITHAISGHSAAIDTYTDNNNKKHGQYTGKAPEDKEPCVYIGTNVEYAQYIEHGTGKKYNGGVGGRQTKWAYKDKNGDYRATSGSSGKAFLKPAATQHTSEYREVFRGELKG